LSRIDCGTERLLVGGSKLVALVRGSKLVDGSSVPWGYRLADLDVR
jgi:hypothetical protein